VQDTPGLEALTADLEMVRGTVTVRGKVTDKATDKPVVGARVTYVPLYGNETAAKLHVLSFPTGRATTGADGTYAVPVMPGPGLMLAASPRTDAYMFAWSTPEERKAFFKTPLREGGFLVEGTLAIAVGGGTPGATSLQGYHAVVLLEPGEKEESLVRDVALDRGQQRKGRVVGPDGQPLTGVTVQGLLPRAHVVETLQGAEFTVRGLNPKAPPRLLVFQHKGKNLGSVLKGLPAEKDGPLIVKLQPFGSLSGRIVDRDGQPVSGCHGRLFIGPVGYFQKFTTDKEGRFRVGGLVPGLRYLVGGEDKDGRLFLPFQEGAVVEPGKNKDLGDFKLIK
jgi:hypothetical protein